jgi:hypothetical protein
LRALDGRGKARRLDEDLAISVNPMNPRICIAVLVRHRR